MLKHYHREKDVNGNDIKYKNQSIDKDLTYLNKQLIKRDITDLEFIHQRMSEVVYQDRKDINVMADWIITAPEEYKFTDQEKNQLRDKMAVSSELKEKLDKLYELFNTSFEILKQRYGEKNIINCCIHYDETTPHIHFAFMPIIMDRKKIRGKDEYIEVEKLNAKKCLSKMELSVFHKEVQKELNDRLSFKVKLFEEVKVIDEKTGEVNYTSPTKLKGNQSINQLKKENAILEYENNKLVADRKTLIDEMAKEKRYTESYIASQERSLNKIADDTKLLVTTYKNIEEKINPLVQQMAEIAVINEQFDPILSLSNKTTSLETDNKGNPIFKKNKPLLKVLFTTDGWNKLQNAITKLVTFFKNLQSLLPKDIVSKAQQKIIDEKPKSILDELSKYKERKNEYQIHKEKIKRKEIER